MINNIRRCKSCLIFIDSLHANAQRCRLCAGERIRESMTRSNKKHYLKNRQAVLKACKEWQEKNPASNRRKALAWYTKNKDAINKRRRKSKA